MKYENYESNVTVDGVVVVLVTWHNLYKLSVDLNLGVNVSENAFKSHQLS